MIKINLIQQRRRTRSSRDPAQQVMLAGFATFLIAGAGIYFGLHSPMASKIDDLTTRNDQLVAENKAIQDRTKDYDALKAAVDEAKQEQDSIDELNKMRAVPAWLLHELSQILSAEGHPTMTEAMARRVRDDPNRGWAEGWDPKHVWITSFSERGGKFRLEGSAQSDSDMTQLALRMQASAYFDDVVPEGGSTSGSGDLSVYRFVISGKLRY